MKNKKKKQKAFLVNSTHWDREWYEPFQVFRYRLVSLLDEVLGVMQNDKRFSHFQMDGQSAPIEDYLEIKPEQKPLVKTLAQEARLALGPWYTMSDEFIVSGESLIRNLKEGLRVAKNFGIPSRVGFVCDIFGHNSQMPQIFRGFEIKCALVWRGINEQTAGPFFRWRSPDGSEVLSYRLGPNTGYGDYAFLVRNVGDHSENFNLKQMLKRSEDYIKRQADRCGSLPLLLFNGSDHLEVHPRTGELAEKLSRSKAGNHYDIRIGRLDDFAEELLRNKSRIRKTITGELREPFKTIRQDGNWVIPGVLSSRIPLKQDNAECESLLTQWAEPFSAFASTLGMDYPYGFLRTAWRYLLLNHAHDSICGCSIDQVHKDMQYRFDQAKLVAKRLRSASLEYLSESIARKMKKDIGGKIPKHLLVLFNPCATPIREPVDFTVVLPRDTPLFSEFFGYEPKPGFHLFDEQELRIPYQRISQKNGIHEKIYSRYKMTHAPVRWHVNVTAELEVPAFGYTSLVVETTDEPTRQQGKGLATGSLSAENETLKISFTKSGHLSLFDKKTGQTYENLLQLEDRADIGDGWYHGVAVNDEIHYSGFANASVSCIADGPLKTTFRVELHWHLPDRFDFNKMKRSAKRIPLRIDHEVTIRKCCSRIEVHTIVQNKLKDHRVRVLFPTNVKADYYYADSPFDVAERPIALDPENKNWYELEVETKPQQSWTAVAEKGRGLAVISKGLPESAVCDTQERPIALTLFRSFEKTFMTNGEPGGQIQEPLHFDYWIVPLEDQPNPIKLSRYAAQLTGGIFSFQPQMVKLTNQPKKPERTAKLGNGPVLPRSGHLLRIKGDVIVTAIKLAQDGDLIIRFFNQQDSEISCEIEAQSPIQKAWLCNLEEQPQEEITVKKRGIAIKTPARKIITVKIKSQI